MTDRVPRPDCQRERISCSWPNCGCPPLPESDSAARIEDVLRVRMACGIASQAVPDGLAAFERILATREQEPNPLDDPVDATRNSAAERTIERAIADWTRTSGASLRFSERHFLAKYIAAALERAT